MTKHASYGRQAALRAGYIGFVVAACLMILGEGATLTVFGRLLAMAALVWLAISGRSWAAWFAGAWLVGLGAMLGIGELLNGPLFRALVALGLGLLLVGSGVVLIHFRHALGAAATD